MKRAIIIFCVLLPAILSAQALTDTLWSVASMDGTISYRPAINLYHLVTSGAAMTIGDGYDAFNGAEYYARGYLSFRLTELSHLDSLSVLKAVVGVYQFDSFGNSQQGVYPIWNVAGGDTHFCVLDHIDYGASLDLGDWTAGDPGDPQTLQTNIGIISDNAVVEYKTLDVTGQVRNDIANERTYSQYRMRFTIDRDFDLLGDFLSMVSGNAAFSPRPYLAVLYDTSSMAIDYTLPVVSGFILEQNYPNPFNPVTTIRYSIPKTGYVELTVFNALGHKIETLINNVQTFGDYSVDFNASHLSSGVYYYRLKFEQHSLTKKMLLIR